LQGREDWPESEVLIVDRVVRHVLHEVLQSPDCANQTPELLDVKRSDSDSSRVSGV
jgi:hypothetical protein